MRTFEGVKVIDFTQAIAGPYATFQLALMGADVIKIEQPGMGDQGRQMYPLDDPFKDEGFSAIFMSANAGKRSLTLDLKHEAAAGVIERLVRDADVVVENFKAGTMARRGFGWEDLRKINPKLVYCSVTGFGQTGPRAAAAALCPPSLARAGSHFPTVEGALPAPLSLLGDGLACVGGRHVVGRLATSKMWTPMQ